MDAPVQHKLLSVGPLACTNKQFYTKPKHSRSAHSAEWQGNREAISSRCRRLLLADCRTCSAGARAWPDLGNQIQQGRVTHETRDENEPLSACFERVKRRGVTCRLLRCGPPPRPAAPACGTTRRQLLGSCSLAMHIRNVRLRQTGQGTNGRWPAATRSGGQNLLRRAAPSAALALVCSTQLPPPALHINIDASGRRTGWVPHGFRHSCCSSAQAWRSPACTAA